MCIALRVKMFLLWYRVVYYFSFSLSSVPVVLHGALRMVASHAPNLDCSSLNLQRLGTAIPHYTAVVNMGLYQYTVQILVGSKSGGYTR